MRLLRSPVLCNYYLTYRCNATCSFCDIWERPSPYIAKQDVEVNLRDLRRLGVRVIDFTGGEPLLHRELPHYLQLAKSLGFITTITTNCLLYPKRAESLAGQVDMLHFSLDYATAEKHDDSRGVPCFEKVMESIQLARSLGERPDILFTAFNDNIDDIEQVYREISRPNDLMLILNPVFEYNGVGEGLNRDNLDRLEEWGGKKGVFLNQAFIDLRRRGGNDPDDPVCRAASSTVVISPENKLVLPCYHLGMKEIPITGQLFDIWHSKEVEKLKDMEGSLEACRGCTINCYMQPSFAVEVNRYFWRSLASTFKYNFYKGTWKKLRI